MRLAHVVMALSALLMLEQPLCAQENNGVRFQRYGVDDGLSQTTIRDLYQDRQGFIWLGTQDGLNGFDGDEFRVYRNDRAIKNTLHDNHMIAIEPANTEGFWLGTKSGGLALYNVAQNDSKRLLAG